MLDTIKRFFEGLGIGPDDDEDVLDDVALAAAVLLIEAARSDGHFDDSERQAIKRGLVTIFGFSEAKADTIMVSAAARQAESVEIQRFTRAIKDSFSYKSRVTMIELLWQVVLSDGALHHYEDNLIRRVAGLLYVEDRDRGEAKQRVQATLRGAADQ